MISYDIIESGSSGNFAKIHFGRVTIAVDYGFSFKKYEHLLYDVDFILFTHKHSDHLKPASYKLIRKNIPRIKMIGNGDTNGFLNVHDCQPLDVIIESDNHFKIGSISIRTFENYHGDVTSTGFIFEYMGERMLFAHDLSTTIDYCEYLDKTGIKLDYCLLEANYKPEVLQFIEYIKLHTGFDVFNSGSYRHLSTREWYEFTEKYCKEPNNAIQLHKSSTYHDWSGMLDKFDNVKLEDILKWKYGRI